MRTFLVGGAVRDEILGVPARDRDFVVLEVDGQGLEAMGYQRVGKSFPTYIGPDSNDQYSLPRGEAGTLEGDLRLRDLTINSMAKDMSTGEIIDPFGGQSDLRKHLLRMTSEAFFDDDLRLLRLARFCAQFPQFEIEKNTLKECQRYLKQKSNLNWQIERVSVEWMKGLSSAKPERMLEAIDELGLLPLHLPELDRMKGLLQKKKYHPEGDVWIHTQLVFKQACEMSEKPEVRYSALVHDLGKTLSPEDQLPGHQGHESRGLKLVDKVTKRLGLPNSYRELALLVCEYHLKCHRIFEMRPSKVVELIYDLDAFRKEVRFRDFLICCEADDRGKLRKSYPPADFLRDCLDILKMIETNDLVKKYSGEKLGQKIKERYQKIIADIKNMP